MWAISIFSLAHSPGKRFPLSQALAHWPSYLGSALCQQAIKERRGEGNFTLLSSVLRSGRLAAPLFRRQTPFHFPPKSKRPFPGPLAPNPLLLGSFPGPQSRRILCRFVSKTSRTRTTNLRQGDIYLLHTTEPIIWSFCQLIPFQIFKRCLRMSKPH